MTRAVVLHRARMRTGEFFAAFAAIIAGLVVAPPPARALAPTTFDASMWQVDGRVRAIIKTPNAIYLAGKFNNLIGPGGQRAARTNLDTRTAVSPLVDMSTPTSSRPAASSSMEARAVPPGATVSPSPLGEPPRRP